MPRAYLSGVLVALAIAVPALGLEGVDPRTAAGQLAVCGGAANWRAVNYLEFNVKVSTAAGVQGPYQYRWDRHNGYLRLNGVSSSGTKLDLVIDLGSKTGGGWEDGKQLTGKRLGEVMSWALQRFGEDTLWLTFPLEWGAPGVTVKPLPDVPGDGGAVYPATSVSSAVGDWRVTLDPATGRVSRTVLNRKGMTMNVLWSDWQEHGGVYFAGKRVIAETGETVDAEVIQAQAQTPPGVF